MENKKHYNGVYAAAKKNGEPYYRASLTYQRKHISLGSFSTPQNAYNAYQQASSLLYNKLEAKLTLSDYCPSSPLPFEKWVCLLNFRDNGIYFATPIYIRPRFFYYYITIDHVLKFDIDDLFYYSSHKIMCRGRHYFVAEYGMQTNIVSRYGIKNYAVPEVDFQFINGDNTDFRRENLKILNYYYGVKREEKNGQCVYRAFIHIRGNYLVGIYPTAIEAAIAYNKAIDILKKKGITKNFTPNYVEEISSRQYADIYSAVSISKNILNYKSSSFYSSNNRK